MNEELIVDPSVAFVAHRIVRDDNVLEAVRTAFNDAASRCIAAGRAALMVEVSIRVAPQ